jgi:hypothetical protein
MLNLLLIFPHVLLFLPLFVVGKVIKYRSGVAILVHYFEDVATLFKRNLLRVSRVGHRFAFVVLESYMSQLNVGHVLNINPTHSKLALPLVL